MSRLKGLQELIESEFPENWYEKYEFANKSTGYKNKNIKVLSEIAGDQETFRENFFEQLNFSAIEGEHISCSDLPGQLTNIKESLRSRLITIPQAPAYIQGDVESRFSSFINGLIGSLTFYEVITSQIKRNLTYSNKKHLFEQLDKYQDDLRPRESSLLAKELADTFSINMYSLRADHMPLLRLEVLKDLISFSKRLDNNDFTYKDATYVKIILNRVNFLIRKIIYRYQEDETPLIYVIDSEETELSVDQFPISIFNAWDKKCQIHYEKHHNYKAKLKSKYEDIVTLSSADINFSQYHLKTKYFKDISKQISSLERTANDFKSYELGNKSEIILDEAAANISANYLQNNVLSLKIEQEDKDSIDRAFIETVNLQDETRVKNYFPYNKYLFWLSEGINKQFEKDANAVDLHALQRDVDKYESILNELEVSLEWSDEHYFLAYQLPFKECITTEVLNEKQYDIFLASTFVLPIDYRKVRKDQAHHRKNIEKYKLLLEFNKDIQRERKQLESIKEQTRAIQQEVKGTERRTIEILGIFAALVIFASGVTNTLRFDYTPWVAFLFMFALGSSLAVFVAVIITVARGADHFKQNRIIYLTLIGIGVLCWVFLLIGQYVTKTPSQEQKETISTQDTVKSNRVIDSPKVRVDTSSINAIK